MRDYPVGETAIIAASKAENAKSER